MGYSYVDSNGTHIPIYEGGICKGAYYDFPSNANDSINVAKIPVSGQQNPNTADISWYGITNPTAYITIKHNGTNYSMPSYPKADVNVCGVFAIKTTSGDVEGLRFIALAAADEAAAAEDAAAEHYNYNNYIVAFMPMTEAQDHIVEEADDWDDSPSADANDPFNLNPQGGAYAETDPFGYGNEDMEIPNSITELDYSKFITAYTCDDASIAAIGSAIFSDNTWQNMRNKFDGVGHPTDYIISAVEIPYSPGGTPKNFNLGGVTIITNAQNPVPIPAMSQRYYRLDFGSITLKETWGTEKDYSTTELSIFLPYVGVKDLDASILMNSTITVKAWLDAWTGDLLYLIHVNNKSRAYKYLASSGIVYHFQGNCGKQFPLGKADSTNATLALFGAIGSLGVGLATGNPTMTLGGGAGIVAAAGMDRKVSMASGISGGIGRGDQQDAWLIIKQSVPIYPKDWRAHFGAPRFQTFRLGDLNGFVKCYDVHAEIPGASDAERAAVEQALKAGIFVN